MGDEIKIHGASWPYLQRGPRTGLAQRPGAVRGARAAGLRPPVVALVGVSEVRFYDLPNRVDVLPRRQLVRWFGGFPARLDMAEVEDIYAAARLGDTWLDPTGSQFR